MRPSRGAPRDALVGPDGLRLQGAEHSLDQRVAARMPVRGPVQLQVGGLGDVSLEKGRELGVVVVPDGDLRLVLAAAVGEPGGSPGHLQ